MNIKKADFAGSWYPDTAAACEKEINIFLTDPLIQAVPEKNYSAGIVPHAGWYFSGSIACNVIKMLQGKYTTDTIIIFGKHLRASDPATIMVSGACETPLGNLGIDSELAASIADTHSIAIEPASDYNPENTIELQLPFIRYFFGDVNIVPMGIPPSVAASEIGRSVAKIAKQLGRTIKIVGSTDLTHYGPNYGFMPAGEGEKGVSWVKNINDKTMVDAMLSMDHTRILTEALKNHNACCGGAVVGTVSAAKELGAQTGEKLAYTTSYDKSPGDSLVGYAGIVF